MPSEPVRTYVATEAAPIYQDTGQTADYRTWHGDVTAESQI